MIAGRTTSPASSSSTAPCIWPERPTARIDDGLDSARRQRSRMASRLARHQSSGSCSAQAVCGDVNGACSAVADASDATVCVDDDDACAARSDIDSEDRHPLPVRAAFCYARPRKFNRSHMIALRHRRSTLVVSVACAGLLCAWRNSARAGQGRGAGESPASKPPPATVTPQSYPPEQIQAGETRFIGQCGFCHGRDAGGGESGPDLIRSHARCRGRARRQDWTA